MSVARAGNRKSLAFILAFAVLLALAVPFAGIAVAEVRQDNTCDLQVEPEQDSNPTGSPHTLTAFVTNCTGNTALVAFEFESGPAPRVNCTVGTTDMTCTGGTTVSTTDASPADVSCTATLTGTAGARTGQCSFVFTSDTAGTNTIRGWVDDDEDLSTEDADQQEGPDADDTTNEIQESPNATDQEGVRPEVDDTDVVQKTWFTTAPTGAILDCQPEVATNPSTGAESTETYTCRAYRDQNANGQFDAGEGINGFNVDGENLGGVNDPDNDATGGAASTADYNNVCTTGNDGLCTAPIAASEQQAGNALICFWIDDDNDNVFHAAGAENDGGECDDPDEQQGATTGTTNTTATRIGVSGTNTDDQTDVVQKQWRAAGVAANIDCEPETDQNVRGTSHTVTCTVTDEFGNPVQGASVDFSVTGRNIQDADNRTTDAQGRAVFTYNDTNAALATEGQQDVITGCIDPDAVAGCANPGTPGNPEAAAPGGTQEVDRDSVSKFWFTTLPTAATVQVDFDLTDAAGACEEGNARDKTASNPVNTTHEFCVVVEDAQGNRIPGEQVTLTLTGPGSFVETEGTATLADDDDLGQSTTVTTDANGVARADIFSTQSGTTTVTATADNQSDTATKTWTALEARNIACTPETASNEPGTEHVVTCTVTDRFGNPVPNIFVAARESGPGRITGGNNETDANGQTEIITSTTLGETGTQTITAEIAENDPNTARGTGTTDDPCEQPAGSVTADENNATAASGQQDAPAGNCIDSVTKTWEPQATPPPPPPAPECDDNVDNDNDGLIDFPDDPGCDSATDDDESDGPPQEFGGEVGQDVTSGPCAGFTTGSVNARAGGGLVIVGTNGADALQGSEQADLICGLGGADTINGANGDDTIYGNRGRDGINGDDGNDALFGNLGKDIMIGGEGRDTLRGGNQNDNMSGGAGNDTLLGQGGWDTLKGNAGNDTFVGAGGNDIIQGGGGDDVARGNRGDDVLKGFSGADTLRGGGGNDIIRGSAGNDTLRGGSGDDVLNGGAGKDDDCRGGSGDDFIRRCE